MPHEPRQVLEDHADDISKIKPLFDELYLASRINLKTGPNVGPRKKTVLVLNNTFGKMTEIHAASDLVVVVGAKNFFKPLFTGVPTYFLYKENSVYRTKIIRTLETVAADFPNFRVISAVSQIDGLLARADNIEAQEAKTMNRFLDVLMIKLQSQFSSRQVPQIPKTE